MVILVVLVSVGQSGCEFCFGDLPYKAAKQALLEGLGLSHLFSGNRKLTPEEKELWLLFDRVYVTELLARDEFAKGAYMLGAEDRETMLR